MHGDAHLSPANCEGNTRQLDNELMNKLRPIMQNVKFVFIGYGGGDESINKLFLHAGAEAVHNVYWIGPTQPSETAMAEWWKTLPNKTKVENIYFDPLMVRLKDRLDLDAPDFDKVARRLKNQYEKTQEIKTDGMTDKQKQAQDESLAAIAEKAKDWWDIELAADNFTHTDPDKAEAIYLAGIERFQKSTELLGNFSWFLKNIRKDADRAEEYCHKALEADPDHANNLGNYAVFLNDTHKDADRAEEYYQKALDADPDHANNLGNYSQLLAVRGRFEEAKKVFQRSLENSEDPALKVELWFYALAHNFKPVEDALQKLRKLIDVGTRSPEWDFSGNIEGAEKNGNPHVQLLKSLSQVISEGADPAIIEWPD